MNNFYVGKNVTTTHCWYLKLKILKVDAFGFLFEVVDRDRRWERDSVYYEIGGKVFVPHDCMFSFKILD